VPPGGGWGAMAPGCFPSASFDFYPYCGIQRSVLVCVRPRHGITGLTVNTRMWPLPCRPGSDTRGVVELGVQVDVGDRDGVDDVSARTIITHIRATLEGRTGSSRVGVDCTSSVDDHGRARLELCLEPAALKLWGPSPPHGTPFLYTLRLEALGDSPTGTTGTHTAVDSYEQRLGMRVVEVRGSELLLNGHPLKMRGFGRHEDFPLLGRADSAPVLVRDHAALAWVGANSYRTAHYPYSETDLELADERGLLVVSESPCVGLSFHDAPAVVAARQAQALAALRELIVRDRCRTCVVAWSVCNEPGGPKSVPTADAKAAQTAALKELVSVAKSEGSRPVTFANIPEHCDEANHACDFLCLNEYAGWYYDVGKDLDAISSDLEAKLEAVHAEFGKPLLISECGADTLSGCHMLAPGLWSEELQAALLGVYAALAEKHPWLAGVHVWNLNDFRTPQMHIRAAGLNHKGVFSRLREPKMAAHSLKRAWAAAAAAERGAGPADPKTTAGSSS